jgi:hypothetical protein
MTSRRWMGAILVCFGAVCAAESRLPLVAVMPFASRSVDVEALDGIGAALSSELLRTGRMRVLERGQMDAILREQSFQASGSCEGGECAVELGRLLSVDQMIVGSIAKVGETYSVTARQVRVGSGEVIRSVTHNTRARVDAILTDLVPRIARDLAEPSDVVADATPPAKAPPLESPSRPPAEVAGGHRSVWPWIAGGIVLLGAGATVAVLLLSDEAESAPQTPSVQDQSGRWETTVRWK